MEYRVCVAVVSTEYPHKSNISLQNAKKRCFEMEYRICLAVESDSIPTQIVYFIVKRLKKYFEIEYRVCVTVESSQYPHKSYIPWQNVTKMVFCNRISYLCGC